MLSADDLLRRNLGARHEDEARPASVAALVRVLLRGHEPAWRAPVAPSVERLLLPPRLHRVRGAPDRHVPPARRIHARWRGAPGAPPEAALAGGTRLDPRARSPRSRLLGPLLAVLTAALGGCRDAPIPPLLREADGLLVEEGALFDGPEASAARTGALPRLTLVRLAARGLVCHRHGEGLCAERWRLAGTDAWVDGSALAVAQATPSLDVDLGGFSLREHPEPSDRSRAPSFTWFGVQGSWEWDEEVGRNRRAAEGWLAAASPEGLRLVPLGRYSGWGSAEVLFDRRWLDLDADGAAELIVAWRASITEVGYGGQHVRVLGPDLATKLEIEVGDPTLTGLGQSAWGAVRLEGAELVHEELQVAPCAPGLPPPTVPDRTGMGATVCFTGQRTRWSKLAPRTEPLRVEADGGEVLGWYHPEGVAPTEAATVRVLARRDGRVTWIEAPALTPSWTAGVFGADQERSTWVKLW